MRKTSEKADKGRRDFLKMASVTAPAAVAAAALGAGEAEAAGGDSADATVLKDTTHTRAYYKSARF